MDSETTQLLVDDHKDFLNVQFEQAVETYRSQLNVLVQILTILVIANATVVGFAISSQIAGIIFIGSLFPVVCYAVTRIVLNLLLPVLYTAIKLEDSMDIANFDGLVTSIIAITNTEEYLEKLRTIAKNTNSSERIRQLKAINPPSYLFFGGRWGRFVELCLLIVFIGQIIAPFILSYYFGWRLL